MFAPFVLILLALWVIGMVSSHTFGGLIHLLPAIVASLLLVRFLRKRKEDKVRATARARKRKLMLRSQGGRG